MTYFNVLRCLFIPVGDCCLEECTEIHTKISSTIKSRQLLEEFFTAQFKITRDLEITDVTDDVYPVRVKHCDGTSFVRFGIDNR